MIRTAVVALLSSALVLAAAPAARADDVEDAKAHFRRGAELYRAGKWRDAIHEFEAAYRLKPHGAIHFNVAQCREKLGEWPGALRAYGDYLREVPDAKDRAAVRAAIARIERRLAAAGVQALLVYTDPPGATVAIEGRPSGTTPFHTVLPPGTYALSLSLDGYEPVKQEVALAADASRQVDVVLRNAAPAPGKAPAVAAPAPPQGVAPQGATPAPPPAAKPGPPASAAVPLPPPPDLKVQPPRAPPAVAAPLAAKPPAPSRPAEKRRLYTWIAAGAAAAALAAGGYYGWSASRDASEVRSSSPPSDPSQTAAYQSRLTQLASDARSKSRTANVLYAAGAGAGAVAVTLFFVEKRF